MINNINYTIIIKLNQVHSNYTVPPSHLIYNKMCLIFAPLKKQVFYNYVICTTGWQSLDRIRVELWK